MIDSIRYVLRFSYKLLIYKDAVNTSLYALPPRPCYGSLINQHLAALSGICTE